MSLVTSIFQVIFGRRGARTAPRAPSAPRPTTPRPPAAAPPPTPAPAPAPETTLAGGPEPSAPPAPSAPDPDTTLAGGPTEAAPPPAAEPAPPPAPEPPPVVAAPEPPPPASTPAADPGQLTPHFHVREFIVTNTGLPNTPDAEELERIRFTAQRMEKVRELLGGKPITINSCFRSRVVNEAVGGVENSAHRKGYAVDFTCRQFGTPYQIVDFLRSHPELMADVDQVIFECSKWVHISFEPRNPCRKQVLTGYYQPGHGGKVFYLTDLHPLRDDGFLPDTQA